MMPSAGTSPPWLVAIAGAVESFLREAVALPPAVVTAVDENLPTGWYAQTPSSAPTGRTPWIHMSDVSVSCVKEAIVLTFRWKPDEPATAPTYLLPVTTIEADPMTGSDALITRLDFFLDSGSWREQNTYAIGNQISVVVAPPAKTAMSRSLRG